MDLEMWEGCTLPRHFHLLRDLLPDKPDAFFDRNGCGTHLLTLGAIGAKGKIEPGVDQVMKGSGKGIGDIGGAEKFLPRDFKKRRAGRIAIAAIDAIRQTDQKLFVGQVKGQDSVVLVMIQKGFESPLVTGEGFFYKMEEEIKPKIGDGDDFF